MTIELRDVTIKYGKTKALDEVSIRFDPGELVAVVGLNGAGKSTLLRALSGLEKLKDGNLYLNELPFRLDRLDVRREMMFIPDCPDVILHESLLRNISLFVTHYDRTEAAGIEERILDQMQAFDLLDKIDRIANDLSRGELYKFGLVLLKELQLKLWLLDEPFASGMDAPGIRKFRTIAKEFVEQGGSVIYSTQMVDLAEGFSDRIVVIDRGKIIADTNDGDLSLLAESQPVLQKLLGEGQLEGKGGEQ